MRFCSYPPLTHVLTKVYLESPFPSHRDAFFIYFSRSVYKKKKNHLSYFTAGNNLLPTSWVLYLFLSSGIYHYLLCGMVIFEHFLLPRLGYIDFSFSSVLGKCERAESSIWWESTGCDRVTELETNLESWKTWTYCQKIRNWIEALIVF